MRFSRFGRHLHNQIVLPLLAASVIVALIATLVGVYRLNQITDVWARGDARMATQSTRSKFTELGNLLQSYAKLASEEPALRLSIQGGDLAAIQREITALRRLVDADNLCVLDPQGRVVANSGNLPLVAGDTALTPAQQQYATLGMRFVAMTTTGNEQSVSAIEPKNYAGSTYTIVLSKLIDEAFLKRYFTGVAAGVIFSGAGSSPTHAFIDADSLASAGSLTPVQDRNELSAALSEHPQPVARAVANPGQPIRLTVGANTYTALSVPVLGTGPMNATPAEAGGGHAVVLFSDRVAQDTSRATIGLIAFWSALAVMVLTGLGYVIARQVSVPLQLLSQSARRVADGDFSSRVDIGGNNEVADLAENFNSMTGSLRERTDTLTKKVLELATLYEMSRSLGSTLDLDTLLESVLDSALRIFNVDSGYVMLRNRTHGGLDMRSWRGLATAEPDEKAIRSSMSDWVVRQGRPLIFNPSQDPKADQQVDTVTGALAALCVPLISSDGVVGAIAVGSRDRAYRFTADDVRLLSTIANHVTIAIGNIELFSSLQDAYLATVRSLAAAVDAKDPFTHGHSDKVASFSGAIAERLELSGEQVVALEMAAYLHDIGKIGVKESILLKPGRLTDDEMIQMRHHPLIGANILKPVAFPWPIAPVVRHHHEHYDGGGYPAGLKGEEIPLLARVLTVADAFEAMTADRPYRPGRTREEAVEELRRCEGTQFDPRIVEALIAALDDMDDSGAVAHALADEVQPEEARAIFVAIVDGMFSSFRRLGGPRLATNLETDLNAFFSRGGLPFSMSSGHVVAVWQEETPLEAQVEDMRSAIALMSRAMESATGRSLVDHFYNEALDGLSQRMRRLAGLLKLHEPV